MTATSRRTVELTLSEDLLRRANTLTEDLSTTVERLLATFVNREEARGRDEDDLREVIEALNAVHAQDGLLSDDFPSF